MVQRLFTGTNKRLPRNRKSSEDGKDNIEELAAFSSTAKLIALTARQEPVFNCKWVACLEPQTYQKVKYPSQNSFWRNV